MSRRLAALPLLLLAVGASSCAAPAGKSGSAEGVTLHLAVAGYPGSASGRLAERFARLVESASKGLISVAIEYPPAAGEPQAGTVGAVRSGEVELAIAPAEAYQVQGAATLGALEAPFLITSVEGADRVTDGPVAVRVTDGLHRIGLTGLALVPEGLYRPFGFLKPLETPADFDDVTIRAPDSPLAVSLLRALGAHPVSQARLDVDTALRSGFASAPAPLAAARDRFPAQMFAAANVVFFPDVDVLAASSSAFDRLSGAQRALLRRAAAGARSATIVARDEHGAAQAYCSSGGTLVEAPAAGIQALKDRAAAVLARLGRDPATRALVSELHRIGGGGAMPGRCNPRSAAANAGVGFDHLPQAVRERLLPPDGSYRRVITDRALRSAGASEQDVGRNDGVVTLTVAGRRPFAHRLFVQLSWQGAARPPCRGRAGAHDGRVAVRWNPSTPCTTQIEFSWRLDRGDLLIDSLAGTEPPWARRAYLGRWKRVDCTPTDLPSTPGHDGGGRARLC